MKPVIGITMSYGLNAAANRSASLTAVYIELVEEVGGLPLLLPIIKDEADIDRFSSMCNGMIFTGGGDVHPSYFGEEPSTDIRHYEPERDTFEFALFNAAHKRGLPMLGICRGAQFINIALGGDIYQHIEHDQPDHRHKVTVYENTELYDIVGKSIYDTNSYHHQAIRRPAEGMQVLARASDGAIEAVRSTLHPFIWCFQWHPELMYLRENDAPSKEVFRRFVDACRTGMADGTKTNREEK